MAVLSPTDNNPLAAVPLLDDAKAILHRTSMPWRLPVRNWDRDNAFLMAEFGAATARQIPRLEPVGRL
jgi:hypothetical protein